jgi:hypothetical protein
MNAIKVVRANVTTDSLNLLANTLYYSPVDLPTATAAALVASGAAQSVALTAFATQYGAGIKLLTNVSGPNLPRSFFANDIANIPADMTEDQARRLIDAGYAVASVSGH